MKIYEDPYKLESKVFWRLVTLIPEIGIKESAWRKIYNGKGNSAYQAIAGEALILMDQAVKENANE